MGLPEIIIDFKAKGGSAIRRSKGGIALLLFDNQTKGGQISSFREYSEVLAGAYTEKEGDLIKSAFEFNPEMVICAFGVYSGGQWNTAMTEKLIEKQRFNWMGVCCEKYSLSELKAFVLKMRDGGRFIKAVCAHGQDADCEAIVQVAPCTVTLGKHSGGGELIVPSLCGLLAATPLGAGVTYSRIDLTSYEAVGVPNNLIENGKIVLVRDEIGYKIARGVTSLKTVGAFKSGELKKIKIIEAMDTIRADVLAALEENYIGRVTNDYNSKLLLAGAIQGYFELLGENVLDKSYENRVLVSYEGQRQYLISKGIDVAAMSENDILRANTGSYVFLEVGLRFVDAMEDVKFTLMM